MLLIVNATSTRLCPTDQVAPTDASDAIAARSRRQRGCKRFRERNTRQWGNVEPSAAHGYLTNGFATFLLCTPSRPPEQTLPVGVSSLIWRRRTFAGSLVGCIVEMQEMLDFRGKHSVIWNTEVIRMKQVNGAYQRMLRSDVK